MPVPDTGANNLRVEAASAAVNLTGPALQLASGASLLRTATDTLKGAAIDKLLGPTALFAGGLIGIVRTMKAIVEQSGLLERGLQRIANVQQIQGKFETLLKSAEAATQRIRDLYKFVANSPFDFSDVAEANRILEALTKGALSGTKGMEMIGDAAAATGQSMTEVADRVGKLYAALRSGRSLDKILFQLQATGAVSDDLAAQLENLKMAGAGFEEMWAAVTKSLSATEGGMKNEMNSIDALGKRIKVASELMEAAFAEPFKNAQATAMQNTVDATKNLTPVLAQIGKDIAPLLTFFTNVKNEIAVATLATKGFANGLTAAWAAAKGLFVGAAATSIASFAINILKTAKGVQTFAVSLQTATEAAKLGGDVVAGLAKAQEASAAASIAFAEGNLLSAAGLKAQALWATASARALVLHRGAVTAATVGTAGFNVTTYLASIAAGSAVGAFGLLKKAAMAVGTGIGNFITANPILAIGTAAVAVASIFRDWADSVKRTNDEYINLIYNLARTTNELSKQARAVQNLDQYREAVAKNTAEQENIKAEITGLGERPKAVYGTRLNADYSITSTGQVTNRDALDKYDEKKSVLEEALKRVQSSRKLLETKLPGIGIGREQRQQIFEDTGKRIQNRDASEQSRMSRASDLDRRNMMNERFTRLQRESEMGERIAAGRLAPEKFKDNPTELMRLSASIAAREAANQKVPVRDYERQAELNNLADTHLEKRSEMSGMLSEMKSLDDSIKRSLDDVSSGQLANMARINDDPKMAKAFEDANAREQLRQRYKDLGLTRDQADADFKNNILGEAAAKLPRVTADSLQSIGGGGSSYGSSPILAAQERHIRVSEASKQLLEQIAKNTAGGGLD